MVALTSTYSKKKGSKTDNGAPQRTVLRTIKLGHRFGATYFLSAFNQWHDIPLEIFIISKSTRHFPYRKGQTLPCCIPTLKKISVLTKTPKKRLSATEKKHFFVHYML